MSKYNVSSVNIFLNKLKSPLLIEYTKIYSIMSLFDMYRSWALGCYGDVTE